MSVETDIPVPEAAPPPAAPAIDPDLVAFDAFLMRAGASITDRLVATADDDCAVRLGQTLTRLARAVRQSKLLAAKLADGSIDAFVDHDDDGPAEPDPRITKVREVLTYTLDKLETEAMMERLERLDPLLEAERLAPERPVVESVVRIANALGVRELVHAPWPGEWEDYPRRTDPGQSRWRKKRPP